MDDDYVIDVGIVTGFVEIKEPKIKPYTFWEIRRILRDIYGLEMDNIFQGYKANRRPNYHELYRLIDIDTGKIEVEKASLDGLRKFFSEVGYPCNKLGEQWRDTDAEAFMQIIKELKTETMGQSDPIQ